MVTAVAVREQTMMSVDFAPKPAALGTLPDALSRFIVNFLSMQNIAQSVRHVKKEWRYYTHCDGRLDLSKTTIDLFFFGRIILNYLTNLRPIRSMSLANCPFLDGDVVCAFLDRFPSLTKLRLPTSTTDDGLSCFQSLNCPLERLSLKDCLLVTDSGLKELAQMPFPLNYLNLDYCGITGIGVKLIAKFPLTYLGLLMCKEIDDDTLKALSTCPLRTLKLQGGKDITDIGMGYISEHSLTRLDLTHLVGISDKGFSCLNKMPLRSLCLHGTLISEAGLLSLNLPSLTNLDLGRCRQLSGKGLQGLSGFPSLKKLSLKEFRITDDAIVTLSQLKLTSLSIPETDINNTQLEGLSQLPLGTLNILGCDQLSEGFGDVLLKFAFLQTLRLTHPRLRSLVNAIAFPIGVYFQRIHLFGEEIPASVVSKPVEVIYETILDYLEY